MTPAEAFEKPVIVKDPETGEPARVTRLDDLHDGRVRVQFATQDASESRRRGWTLTPRVIAAVADLEMVGAY